MNSKSLFWILFLIISNLNVIVQAQENINYDLIKPRDGLSYRHVTDVIQDKNDFMWFSTLDGINRYDGNRFVVYKHDFNNSNSLTDNSCQWLFEDYDKNIIVGTEGGVNVLFTDEDSILLTKIHGVFPEKKFISTKPVTAQSGEIYSIGKIFSDNSIVLLEYVGSGNFRLIGELNKDIKIDDFFGLYPLWQDSGNNLWYADQKAFYRISRQDVTIEKYQFNLYDKAINMFEKQACPIDSKGRLWFPQTKESDSLFQFFTFPENLNTLGINGFFIDNKHNIWLKNKDGVQWKINLLSKEVQKIVEFPDQLPVDHMFNDKHGNSWIPHEFGLTKIKSHNHYFNNHFKDQIIGGNKMFGSISPYKILEDNTGNIVFIDGYMIRHADLSIINGKTPKDIIVKSGPALKEWTINLIKDSKGKFWYPQKNKLVCYNPQNESVIEFSAPGELASLEMDHSGKIWLTENPGGRIFIFDPGSETFEYFKSDLIPSVTNAMTVDGENLWISSPNGLVKINTNSKEVNYIELFEELQFQSQWINAIIPYKDYIWLATINGLLRFEEKTQELKIFNTKSGLPHNIIYSIIPFENELWLGTHHGLCMFNLTDNATKNFFEIDGLNNSEFNRNSALFASDSTMYFGGLNGITSFKPNKIDFIEDRIPSRLVWTSFTKWNNKKKTDEVFSFNRLKHDSTIYLKYKDHSFVFNFSLLNYTDPLLNSYSYMLEGYDFDWHMLGNKPYAIFNNLNPGHYKLRVRGADLFGTNAQNELLIPIVVSGPWYNTWWSYLLLAFVLILIGFGIRWYEIRLQKIKNETENLKLLGEAKSKLYSNITHEFRTPLTVIKGMAADLKGYALQKDLIERNSDLLLNLINQILSLSKLESGSVSIQWVYGDIVKYIKYVIESFQFLAVAKDIQLIFYSEVEHFQMNYDEEKIQHIVSNLLSNAIKYSDEKGQIIVHLNVEKNESNEVLKLKVRDDGIGIAKKDIQLIFERFFQSKENGRELIGSSGIGLALTKELVYALKGKINVESRLGEGSEFIIELPVDKSQIITQKKAQEESPQNHSVSSNLYDKVEIINELGQRQSFMDYYAETPVLLIIEDNEDVSIYLKSILKDKFIIHFAPNGEEGIEKAFELVPDIIISDVMMPKKNGYEVCYQLKNDLRTSHIPIILLTAKVAEKDLLTGLEKGADAYLTKPFKREELLLRLKKLVELRKKLQISYSEVTDKKQAEVEITKEHLFLQSVNETIDKYLSDPDISIEIFARALKMSRSQLFRKVKALTGKSISVYIRCYRLNKAKQLILDSDRTISEIAYDVGFSDLSYFSAKFREEFGESPSSLRVH